LRQTGPDSGPEDHTYSHDRLSLCNIVNPVVFLGLEVDDESLSDRHGECENAPNSSENQHGGEVVAVGEDELTNRSPQ